MADDARVRRPCRLPWQEPDAGIWEIRGDAAHHVHSKLMGWLAPDRALRIARSHPLTARRRRRWEAARDALAADLARRGVDPATGTYTRSYGSTDLDAALLVLPCSASRTRARAARRGTIDAVAAELDAGWPLLYRCPPGRDGLPGSEGAFPPCSFWLAAGTRPHRPGA